MDSFEMFKIFLLNISVYRRGHCIKTINKIYCTVFSNIK